MNQLKNENSIYLLQHAHNPIDWFPWGERPLQKAKDENKPIFLSIGYAACHWCHVMEKETFVNQTVADFMNQHFIAIEVDREERPDIDKVYMDAVMALTGQGGWPLSVFLTPEGHPFYGGTYFPPSPRYGMPSFMQIVSSIQENWASNRAELIEQAETVIDHIRTNSQRFSQSISPSSNRIDQAIKQIIHQADKENGGWGRQPKFPHPMVLDLLLLHAYQPDSQETIETTLNHMSQGGMYDLSRGGFHRYSTDQVWRIPHFEKMLYDNAQLPKNYLTAGLLFDNISYFSVAMNTLDFIKNELTAPSGLFWSSIDADSDGEEGKYYIWDKAQLSEKITQASLSPSDFEIIPDNQLTGKAVVRFHSSDPDRQIHDINHPLYKSLRRMQKQRQRPIIDDKVLTDWNALTIQAFAYAAWILDRQDYKKIALHAAHQLLTKHITNERLRHSARLENVGKSSFLSDYANMINALIDIFYLVKDKKWFFIAQDLSRQMLQLFYSDDQFYDTPQDQNLIIRPKTIEDNVMPSGVSAAVFALIKLNLIDQNPTYTNLIDTVLTENLGFIFRYPLAAANWLQAIYHWMTPPQQLMIVLPETHELDKEILTKLKTRLPYLGQLLIGTKFVFDQMGLDLFQNKITINDQPTFYLCKNHTCSLPTNVLEQILIELEIPLN